MHDAYADPELSLEHQQMMNRVLTLRGKGKLMREIAVEVGLSESHVKRLIRDAANAVREDNLGLISEMFLIHQERLEHLYSLVAKHMDESPVFDDRVIRAAISILERQAKLLGLDRDKDKGGRNDWLENATPEELIREAERLGVRVPEKFKLPTRMGEKRE